MRGLLGSKSRRSTETFGIKDVFGGLDSIEKGGYRATIVYEDGYVETIPVATLVRLHKRKERETGLMHERFVGVTFEKAFGELGVFSGVVQEVWRHDNGTYQARVFYTEDGDAEDITIEELVKLLEEEKQRHEESVEVANRERLNGCDELDGAIDLEEKFNACTKHQAEPIEVENLVLHNEEIALQKCSIAGRDKTNGGIKVEICSKVSPHSKCYKAKASRTPPGLKSEWPIFEVTEEDLVRLWNQHSLSLNRNECTILAGKVEHTDESGNSSNQLRRKCGTPAQKQVRLWQSFCL